MPVESVEVGIQESERRVTPKELQEGLFIPIVRGKKEKEKPQYSIEDEYQNVSIATLRPLKSVNVEMTKKDSYGREVKENVNFDEDLNQQFEYLSRTHQLETETPKTQALQRIVDNMLEGRNLPTRVVVMNKGEAPNAFVMADGTIFVSQSLLNKLDCIDEIASVIAHEIEHLINQTFENRIQSHSSMGVGWAHEGASDQFTPTLLEKVDLNSLAFASAIQKVSGAERGMIHQGGIARASEIVGQHLGRHYRTSNKPHTPKPQELNGEVQKTNLEIFNEIFKLENRGREKPIDMEQFQKLLIGLHPNDFRSAYAAITGSQYHAPQKGEGKIRYEALTCANDIIFAKLRSAGFNDEEITTLLISSIPNNYSGASSSSDNLYLIKDIDQFERVIDGLSLIEKDKKLDQMAKLVFGRGVNQSSYEYQSDYRKRLLDLVAGSYFIEGLEEGKRGGGPIDEDLLIKFLANLSELYPENSKNHLEREMTRLLLSYVDRVYLAVPEQAGSIVDEAQIRDFFEKVKLSGIPIYTEAINDYISKKTVRTIDGEMELSEANQQAVADVFCQVFEYTPPVKEKTSEYTFEKIDNFIIQLKESLQKEEYSGNSRFFDSFVGDLGKYFDEYKVADADRLKFLEYLDGKLSELEFSANYSIRYLLSTGRIGTPSGGVRSAQSSEDRSEIDQTDNDRFMKFNLRTFLALRLFEKDSDVFYLYMEKAMKTSGIDLNGLDRIQMLNLLQGLLAPGNRGKWGYQTPEMLLYGQKRADYHYFGRDFTIENYEKYFNLPFLKHFLEQKESSGFTIIKELNNFVSESMQRLMILQKDGENCDLFSDTFSSLLFGKNIRDNLISILEKGISEQELNDLYQFIANYYSGGVIKDQLLAQINIRYLKSENISLEEKVDYLLQNYDRIGPEGTILLADQITDLNTYDWFRQKLGEKLQDYLKGSSVVTKIALSDFATSFVSAGYGSVFETSQNSQNKSRQASTNFARRWFAHYFSSGYFNQKNLAYDEKTGKFVFGQGGRIFFQTIADSFTTLKKLSPLQRFAISHKLLTEQYGALSNEYSRKHLSDLLVNALGLRKGFIADALVSACKLAAAEWIAFPASRMISPLLFRSLETDSIDFGGVSSVKLEQDEKEGKKPKDLRLDNIITGADIRRITNAGSREIVFFGSNYRGQSDSPIARLAQDSDNQYFLTNELSKRILSGIVSQNGIEKSAEGQIDPTLEAVISGVEAGGALGVRALQLTTQMMNFPPNIEARLARTLDANPGLNKFLFWENLHKMASESQEATVFLNRIKLGNYLGGGSLYTTFAATYTENGQDTAIVLKMLNPNAERVINESYKIASEVLTDVATQKGSRHNREFARTGLLLIDLSKKWCEADINDPDFAEDDERFKQVVDSFNQTQGREVFSVPTRKFNAHELKSETKAEGQTVNQFLHDVGISEEDKKRVVELMGKFFIHQLRHAPVIEQDGKRYRLIHADPHTGNYVVNMQNSQPNLAVIDRHMYLKLEEKDVAVLEKLISGGNDNDFVYSFLDRVLELNSVDEVQKRSIMNKVFGSLRMEYVKQRVRGEVNRFSLMRVMLSKLSESAVLDQQQPKLEVPLNLRLMLRNVGAFQALMERYGLNLVRF